MEVFKVTLKRLPGMTPCVSPLELTAHAEFPASIYGPANERRLVILARVKHNDSSDYYCMYIDPTVLTSDSIPNLISMGLSKAGELGCHQSIRQNVVTTDEFIERVFLVQRTAFWPIKRRKDRYFPLTESELIRDTEKHTREIFADQRLWFKWTVLIDHGVLKQWSPIKPGMYEGLLARVGRDVMEQALQAYIDQKKEQGTDLRWTTWEAVHEHLKSTVL